MKLKFVVRRRERERESERETQVVSVTAHKYSVCTLQDSLEAKIPRSVRVIHCKI